LSQNVATENWTLYDGLDPINTPGVVGMYFVADALDLTPLTNANFPAGSTNWLQVVITDTINRTYGNAPPVSTIYSQGLDSAFPYPKSPAYVLHPIIRTGVKSNMV
jgi:hypothetical protein